MGREYFFFYAEANIVCIVVLAIFWIHDRMHSTRQEKQICFDRTVIAHILYFISDIGWAAVLSGQLVRTRLLVCLFNFLNFILLSLVAFEWFMYMAASENMLVGKTRKQLNLWRIPMMVSVAVIIIAYIAAPTFWINENGELNIWYYPMMIATPVFYLLAAFVLSIRNARKTDSREERHLYQLIGIYPLGVILFGLIQVFVLNAPLFCFGCMIMMLFFYIQNMQTLVSVDALTRLNNRGQINRYMEQVRYRENIRFCVMMIDVNRFKEINDTWGHAEGDRALVLVSETLKQTAERVKVPVFIGRYGGDEFTLFIQCAAGDTLPEEIAENIRRALAKKQHENRLLYELKVSIGYDVLRNKEDTMEACIMRADEKLYEDKRSAN